MILVKSRIVFYVFAIVIVVGLIITGIGCPTELAIDENQATYRIPPWQYVGNLWDREDEYRRWAAEASKGESVPERQMIALMLWTNGKVRSESAITIDDHIASVVHRGFGAAYQQTEVFTMLTTIMGYESRCKPAQQPPGGTQSFSVCFVEIGSKWLVFDRTHGIWFEKEGHLATVQDFEGSEFPMSRGTDDKQLVGQMLKGDGVAYREYFHNLCSSSSVEPTRAHKQIFWHRILLELAERTTPALAPTKWTAAFPVCERN